jgi:hypothetical protein
LLDLVGEKHARSRRAASGFSTFDLRFARPDGAVSALSGSRASSSPGGSETGAGAALRAYAPGLTDP